MNVTLTHNGLQLYAVVGWLCVLGKLRIGAVIGSAVKLDKT
jgi:hypothetical protein